MATIGLGVAARNGVRAGTSAEAHPLPSQSADQRLNVFGVTVTLADLGTLPVALVQGTRAFLTKTVTGRAIQAVAQNTESATVPGINVPRMVFYTFAINALLGGVVVGVRESLAAYISPACKDAVAPVIFMAVILFKPQGLLGKKIERKA